MLREKSKRQSPSIYLKHSLKSLINQTSALTVKNFLIFSRNRGLSILLIILPFLICLFLHEIQNISENLAFVIDDKDPIEIPLSLPKCMGEGCISLGIGLTAGKTE